VLNAVRARDGERAAAAMRLLILDVLELVSAAAPRSGAVSPKAGRRRA
jgi:DNA-binding GntR family transcriptional regulator